MNDNELRKEIENLKQTIASKREELIASERDCQHRWGETKPAHIYNKAYTIPGDSPGTMGVDFRGPVHVPSSTTKRWKRTCDKCGKIETTTHANQEVIERPSF